MKIYDIIPINYFNNKNYLSLGESDNPKDYLLEVKRKYQAQRIIDLRQDTKDTEFNINDEDLKNGYIGYASWDSKISIPLRS